MNLRIWNGKHSVKVITSWWLIMYAFKITMRLHTKLKLQNNKILILWYLSMKNSNGPKKTELRTSCKQE